MELNGISGASGQVPRLQRTGTARAASPGSDTASFQGTEQLQAALDQVPDARPQEVSRAQVLIAGSSYPPIEMIRRISNLLADNWNVNQGE